MRTSCGPRPPRRQRGAFLIEGLIAIAVFSIGITGILTLVGRMVIASSDAQYRTQAAQFAESILAEMRNADPTTLVAQYGTVGTTNRYGYWTTQILTQLPLVGASATAQTLTITTANGTAIAPATTPTIVTIQWRTSQDTAAGGTAHQYMTQTIFNN